MLNLLIPEKIFICKINLRFTLETVENVTSFIKMQLESKSLMTECMPCTCKKERACIGIACCSIPFIYRIKSVEDKTEELFKENMFLYAYIS
jgi:hypothetical protein